MGVDRITGVNDRDCALAFQGTAPSANSKVWPSVHAETARFALSRQTARSRHKEARNASARRGHSPRRERRDAKGLLPGPLFRKIATSGPSEHSDGAPRADTRPVRARKTGAVLNPADPTRRETEFRSYRRLPSRENDERYLTIDASFSAERQAFGEQCQRLLVRVSSRKFHPLPPLCDASTEWVAARHAICEPCTAPGRWEAGRVSVR